MHKGKENVGILKIILLIALLSGCSKKYDPGQYLSDSEQAAVTDHFLPYILPRPDKVSLQERFSDSLKSYYRSQIIPQELTLYKYHIGADSVHYALFLRRDLKSLYIDYRATAATFNKSKDSLYNIELRFMTPMFRRDTVYQKADELFDLLIEEGTVQKYIGNREFIDWPNQDVFYDTREKKWSLIKDSELYKLKEEAQRK